MLLPGSTSLRFLCVNCVKQSSFALHTSFYSKDVRILNKNVWSSSKFPSASKLQNSSFSPNYLSASCLPSSLAISSLSNHLPISIRRMSTALPPENGKEKIFSEEPVKKDNIVTVPNLLCVSRIVAAPVLTSLIVQGNFEAAFALFMLAGFTDLLDGWIARNFKGQASSLGSFLDPLADKILVCTLYLTLTYVNIIPPSLTGLIVSRDLFLVYAGLYIRYMSVPPPFTIKKYLDISLPTATVQPTAISKLNTALQFLLISVSVGAPVLNLAGHPSIHYLWALTGATTFLSAVSYAFMKNTYKFSHRPYDHQFGKKLTAFILFVLFNIGFTLTFPSQALKVGPPKECPITGQLAQDCPVIGATDEIDIYSEKSNQYYLNKIRQTRD